MELKPCPFCGGEDLEINHIPTYDVNNPDVYEVHCIECGGRCGEGWTESEAIAAWNTRAERTCCMTDRGECSECGAYIVRAWTEVHDFNGDVKRIDLRSHSYCPNCGAKVVEE